MGNDEWKQRVTLEPMPASDAKMLDNWVPSTPAIHREGYISACVMCLAENRISDLILSDLSEHVKCAYHGDYPLAEYLELSKQMADLKSGRVIPNSD